ncbi:OsmC/Ohr family [Hyaloraphidium curvatum]|nr:OsmC/Ohr family [Hyaloraphidium curvatum]
MATRRTSALFAFLPATLRGAVRHKSYAARGIGRGPSSETRFGPPGRHTARTDLPKLMGGKDNAPQPVELLLAALVGCESATAAFVARHMRPTFPLSHLEFDYSAERDERGAVSLPLIAEPPCVSHLQNLKGTVVVHLKPGSSDEPQERVEELRAHVEKRCPVASMVRAAGCRVDVEWVLAKDSDPAG